MQFNEFKSKIQGVDDSSKIGDYFMSILQIENWNLYIYIANTTIDTRGHNYINDFIWNYVKANW